MRRFNPDKELNKVQYGDRKKLLGIIVFLLVIIAVGSTYALYQVRHTKSLVYTTVEDFSKDIKLAVFIDGIKATDFPNKDDNYIYDKIICDNNDDKHVTAYWNYDKWKLELKASKKAKCNVYFKTGTDRSGANPPELYQGLIPVTIDDDGTIKVADTSKEWYNYDAKQWANAVVVNSTKYAELTEDNKVKQDKVGETLSLETDILQMYVWIPRYKYQLFNAVVGETVSEQMINIKFESNDQSTGTTKCEIARNGKETCIYDDNGNWYTHPAFTFGETELKGIWFGKFESGNSQEDIKILPNMEPILNINLSSMFKISRNIETNNKYSLNKDEVDTHMMKNMEWGAMAYLTHSKYGLCGSNGICTRVVANTEEKKTGYDNAHNLWNTESGVKASTTGNIYGIYDTNGESWEYAMGVIIDEQGTDILFSDSGFTSATKPNEKYYDLYEYDSSSDVTHERGHLGDATRETLKIPNNTNGAWFNDWTHFPYKERSWFNRGADFAEPGQDGIFLFYWNTGRPIADTSFRVILTAQDGID